MPKEEKEELEEKQELPLEETPEETPDVPEQEEEKPKLAEEEFKPKYKQFWDGDKEAYLKKLEEGYHNSSQEGVRLSTELTKKQEEEEVLKKIVNSDPALKTAFQQKLTSGELDETLYDDDGKVNMATLVEAMRQVVREEVPQVVRETPVLKKMEEDKVAENRKAFDVFTEEHPELLSDPELQKDIEDSFTILVGQAQKRKEEIDFGKLLNKSWTIVTGGQGKTSEESEVEGMKKMIQKENGSLSSPASGTNSPATKSAGSKILTDAEKRFAAAMGLSEEKYQEGKALSESKEIPQI